MTLEGQSGERLLEAALRHRVGGQASPTTPEEALIPRGEMASGSADPLALVSANQPQRRRPGAPMYTPGTARTKSALFKLWCDILAARNLPSLPVDPEKLSIVSSVLRAAGFKSAPAYLYEAKDCHMRAGHAWTDALDIALRDSPRTDQRSGSALSRLGDRAVLVVPPAREPRDTMCILACTAQVRVDPRILLLPQGGGTGLHHAQRD